MKSMMIDTRLFDLSEKKYINDITSLSNENIHIHFTQFKEKGHIHNNDIASTISAGAAIAAVIISFSQLLKKPEIEWSYSLIKQEAANYLELNNIRGYSFKEISFFDNLVLKNGLPAIITIEYKNNEVDLYIGLKGDIILVSSIHYDETLF
jgi:hypothetical protein